MKSRETSKNNPKISKLNNKFVQKHHILAYFLYNKRDFSAKSPLLLLALRPRLFNFVKNYQKSSFLSFKIIDASTILIGILSLFGAFFVISPVSAASLTLTIPSNLSLNITPSVSGTFAKSDQPGTISVITDSEAGYTLGIKAKSDNSLTNGSSKLTSIANQLSEEQYQASGNINTWGFLPSKLNGQTNTNFLSGPSASEATVLDTTDAPNPSGANTYNLTLGAKVDSTIPSGAYSNTFIISATTNEIPLKKFQEWGLEDCSALKEHEVVELEDTRDGNIYKVAKLKDGKCWMAQNLRISDQKLTPANSDVSNDFVLPAGRNTNGFGDFNTSHVQVVNDEYGSYYSYYAATAADGYHYNSDFMPDSICPKGWRLPLSNEISELTTHYNYTSALQPPANFVFSGMNSKDTVYYQGTRGYWWTSNVYDDMDMARVNALRLMTNQFDLSTVDKREGHTIRCISDDAPKITIDYELGLGDWLIPHIQTVRSSGPTAKITSVIPQRTGYVFVGWCDQYTDSSSCSGHTYKAGSGYSANLPETIDGQLKLYAIWQNDTQYLGNLGTMQSFTCSKIPKINNYGIVTDSRDNHVYRVARLKDNKCWMIDNLKLGDSKLTNRTLTSANSDVSSNYVMPKSNKTGFSDASAENVYVPEEDIGDELISFGGYYTWYAATAGTGKKATAYNVQATNSICPKNWRLPTGGWATNSELLNLVKLYGGEQGHHPNIEAAKALTAYPVPGFIYSGNYNNSKPNQQGIYGDWWSSTARNDTLAFYLYFGVSDMNTDANNTRNLGQSIRCMARQ